MFQVCAFVLSWLFQDTAACTHACTFMAPHATGLDDDGDDGCGGAGMGGEGGRSGPERRRVKRRGEGKGSRGAGRLEEGEGGKGANWGSRGDREGTEGGGEIGDQVCADPLVSAPLPPLVPASDPLVRDVHQANPRQTSSALLGVRGVTYTSVLCGCLSRDCLRDGGQASSWGQYVRVNRDTVGYLNLASGMFSLRPRHTLIHAMYMLYACFTCVNNRLKDPGRPSRTL